MRNYKFLTGTLSLTMAVAVTASSFAGFGQQAGATTLVAKADAEASCDNEGTVEFAANEINILTASKTISSITLDVTSKSSVISKATKSSSKVTSKTKVKSKKRKTKAAQRKKKAAKKKTNLKSLGTYTITAYCPCAQCCGSETGITASGTKATAGRTIAADTSVLPFGTKVVINGHTYTVEDRGGAIKSKRIDIFFDTHQEALNWGVQQIEIFVEE